MQKVMKSLATLVLLGVILTSPLIIPEVSQDSLSNSEKQKIEQIIEWYTKIREDSFLVASGKVSRTFSKEFIDAIDSSSTFLSDENTRVKKLIKCKKSWA